MRIGGQSGKTGKDRGSIEPDLWPYWEGKNSRRGSCDQLWTFSIILSLSKLFLAEVAVQCNPLVSVSEKN